MPLEDGVPVYDPGSWAPVFGCLCDACENARAAGRPDREDSVAYNVAPDPIPNPTKDEPDQ